MATDLEQLVLTISADTRQIQRALKKLEGDSSSTFKRIGDDAARGVGGLEKQYSRSADVIQGQTANIAAQFQDIAVQLQQGTSPFTIALQQGTQLGAVLSQTGGGLGGTVKALGAAFASVISPVNLVTIGLIAAGGAALAYFTKDAEAEKLTEAVKRHAAVVAGLKDAYGEAAKGLQELAPQTQTIAGEEARQQVETYRAAVRSLATTITDDFGDAVADLRYNLDLAQEMGAAGTDFGLSQLEAAVESLLEGVRNGTPDVTAFREQMAGIANDPRASEGVRELAEEAFQLAEQAQLSQRRLEALQGGINGLGAAAQANAQRVAQLTGALADLSQISVPSLGDDALADLQYQTGLKAAKTIGEIKSVEAAYLAAKSRIDAANAPRPKEGGNPLFDLRSAPIPGFDPSTKKGGGGGSSKEKVDELTRTTEEIIKQTEQYRLLADAIGVYGMEAEEAQTFVSLLQAAQEGGAAVTDEQKEKFMALAESLRDAKSAVEELRDAQAELDKTARDFNNIARGAVGGFISDLRQGKSAADALANALDRVIDGLINMMLNTMFGQGGGLSGFGSFMSQIFGGMAPTGGMMAPAGGMAAAMVPDVSGGMSSRKGGNMSVSVVNNTGQQSRTRETTDGRGNRKMEVVIGDAVAGEVTRPGSQMHQSIRTAFSVQPTMVKR